MTATIHTGDALAVLRTLPAASIDCCVTDPPYGVTSLDWDSPVAGWLPEVARVLKPSGSLWMFGSMRFLLVHQPDPKAWHFVQDIVWEKHNGSSFHNDRFRRVHEHALQFILASQKWGGVYHQPQFTMDARAKQVRRKTRPAHHGAAGASTYTSVDGGPRLMRSVLAVKSMHRQAIHPTEKPVGILAPLVRYSCPPGGTVLDPFAGSGSTGEAAQAHGCNFIGIEIEPEMAEKARHRIAAADPIGHQQNIEGVA